MKQLDKRVIILMAFLASLVMSCRILHQRMQVENGLNTVAIAMEYGDVLKMATLTGEDPLYLLDDAREAGLNTLVLLDDQIMYPDEKLLSYINLSGLNTAAQFSNQESYLDQGVLSVLANLMGIPNLKLVFFAGYEALGWPDQIQELTQAINYLGISVGHVEMLGEQKGFDQLIEQLGYRMVRIHPGYPYESLDDMVRSVRERGIRFLFVKPFKNMGYQEPQDPLSISNAEKLSLNANLNNELQPPNNHQNDTAALLDGINYLATEVRYSGFELGIAKAWPAISLDPASGTYLILGIIAACFWLMTELGAGRFSDTLMFLTLAVVCIAFELSRFLGFIDTLMYKDIIALVAAISFSSLGAVRAVNKMRYGFGNLSPWLEGMAIFIESSLFTLVGATITNAFLSDVIYLTAWHGFRGVKLALIAPPIIVLIALLIKAWPERADFASLKQIKPLRLGLGFLGIIVGAIYLFRSGNEVSSISAFEQIFRLNLEQICGVRPRFKEFLIGHPATIMLGVPLTKRYPELKAGLLVLMAIGQASLFNTFMHIHTPFFISMRRSLWGIALGEIIGVVVLVICYYMVGKNKKVNAI